MNEKYCKTCKKTKLKSDFHTNKKAKDGLEYWCKSCKSDYYKNRKKMSPDPSITRKVCGGCNINKATSDFYTTKSTRDGYTNTCKICHRNYILSHEYEINPHLKSKKCSRCQLNKPVENFHRNKRLKGGLSSACVECLNSLSERLKKWRRAAKLRRIGFDISLENLEKIPMICYYTGMKLVTAPNLLYTVSLDRLNSKKSYTIDNVVFCCEFINTMKNDLSVEKFVEACKMVHLHFISKPVISS